MYLPYLHTTTAREPLKGPLLLAGSSRLVAGGQGTSGCLTFCLGSPQTYLGTSLGGSLFKLQWSLSLPYIGTPAARLAWEFNRGWEETFLLDRLLSTLNLQTRPTHITYQRSASGLFSISQTGRRRNQIVTLCSRLPRDMRGSSWPYRLPVIVLFGRQ
jgi:hypothetical protein